MTTYPAGWEKLKNMLVQGLKWSLILVALMKKIFFVNVKEVSWNVPTKPLVTELFTLMELCPCGCLPGSGLHGVPSATSLLSQGKETPLRGAASSAGARLGAHLG